MLASSSKPEETPVPDVAPDERAPASVPLYAAALVVQICGLLIVSLILDDPGFGSLTCGLAIIGTIVSYLCRRLNVPSSSIEMPAAFLCVILAVTALAGDHMLGFLAPPSVGDDRGKGLATLLTWLVVFRSFTLVTDGSALFSCVPTIAIAGLVGTMTTETALVTYFGLFAGAAAFMMVHESFLRTRRQGGRSARASGERGMFLGQLQVASICVIGAMIIANILSSPMKAIGSYLVFTPAMLASQAPPNDYRMAPVVSFNEKPEIGVGLGPVTLSDQVVMRVRSDVGSNWRGATFNEYTGRGWRNTLFDARPLESVEDRPGGDDIVGERSAGPPMNRFTIPVTEINRVSAISHRLTQVVHLQGPGTFSQIYAAPECRVVHSSDTQLSIDGAAAVTLGRPTTNAVYWVESDVPDSSPEHLRRSSIDYPREIVTNYLDRTLARAEAMDQIRQAAQQATKGKATTYDKVMGLQGWLSKQCRYNTEAAAIPPDVDVVAHFLFTSHEGYCDSFATALAILCRSIGIPARVASGFMTGTLDRNSVEYAVRESDKHQWTEVYFPNAGWISFDATGEAENISSTAKDDKAKRKNFIMGFLFGRGWLPPVALLLFFLLLGYVLKVEVWDRLHPRARFAYTRGLPATNIAVVESYLTACTILAKRGLPRSAGVTPLEHLGGLTGRLEAYPDALEALSRLTSLAVRFRYDRSAADDGDVGIAKESVTTLRKALKGASRRALASSPVEAPAG